MFLNDCGNDYSRLQGSKPKFPLAKSLFIISVSAHLWQTTDLSPRPVLSPSDRLSQKPASKSKTELLRLD